MYVFDDEDRLINKFGSKSTVNNMHMLYHPEGVAFDSDDHLYVTDCGKHRVQKYSVDGKSHLQFGSIGSQDRELRYPK